MHSYSLIRSLHRISSLRGILAAFALSLLTAASGAVTAEPVRVGSVALGTILQEPQASAPATVVARHAPRIAAEISAAVIGLPVVVGDRVEPGDELARLNCDRYDAQRAAAAASVQRAEAQRQFAERQLRRARDLRKKKSISEELLDQRRTELAGAETDVLSTQATLRQTVIEAANCIIRSPLTAVVTNRHANLGDYLTPGSAVVDLVELAGQEVSVALRADQVDSFHNASAWVFITSGRERPLRLRTIVPVTDPTARTREARLTFDAEPAIPGSPGRVHWSDGKPRIPADYLLRRGGQLGVLVLDANTARFVPLPGAQEGRPAATTMAPDTQLITAGRHRLSDGDTVERIDSGEGRE